MDKDQIKKLIAWLQNRISLVETGAAFIIEFDEPSAADFAAEGFTDNEIAISLESSWWGEMVSDIIETPDFAEPGASPGQVLDYARDVVHEYVAKRLNP